MEGRIFRLKSRGCAAGLPSGDTAPDVTAATSTGKIGFHDWIGAGWACCLSHPGDLALPPVQKEPSRVNI